MRIVHFTNTYYPIVSGVVRSVSVFRQALADQGHSVFIFSQHANDYEDSEPFIFRYPAFELPLQNKFPVIIPVSPFIDRLLPSLKPQVIHAHHPILLGQTAARKAEELDLPFVFTFHTRYREYSHYVSLNQAMVKEIIDRWLGVFIQQCHHIIVPSESIRQILADLYGLREQVTVIPTGIDLGPYATAVGDPIRQKHGWDNDRILISVGRLAKEKNWHELLTAAADVMQSEPNVRLVILGEGEERESLTEQAQELGIADRLELPGTVPFEQVPAYLKAADLFCFASQSETQGLVTLEAMAAGLPIAAYDATGTSDVVVDGENGLLTDNDSQALAQAIRRILTDEALRQKLQEGAGRTAKEYEIGRQAQRLTAVYDQAISDKKANKQVQVDPQKPLLKDKWYELLGMDKNPFEILNLGH
jgi:glycosyltransferase involved in cell wall biosynthesis